MDENAQVVEDRVQANLAIATNSSSSIDDRMAALLAILRLRRIL